MKRGNKLNTFRVLLRYDFKRGYEINLGKIILCLCVFGILCISYYESINSAFIAQHIEAGIGFFDQWIYLFRGQYPLSEAPDQLLLPEPGWLAVQTLPLFLVLTYPVENIKSSNGINVLVRSKSRILWWLSKNAWAYITIILYYLALSAICGIVVAVTHGSWYSEAAIHYWMGDSFNLTFSAYNICICLFSPIISTLLLASIELLISLILTPFWSLIIIFAVQLMTVYWQTPILVGNISMFFRNSLFDPVGIHFSTEFILSCLVSILCLLIGAFYVTKGYDSERNFAMIEVRNFSKEIKGKLILDHVNCSFEPGKVYGLMGVNGSGKTMLMRAIAGLILPSEGSVLIDGHELGHDSSSFPDGTGILIENPSFIDSYTGFKNLKLLASIQKKITDEQIEVALEKVGLDPHDNRKYRKYSLGMKQKLGIAAAVMEMPKIVILDEPLNALDDDGIQRVHKIISELKENGATIIIACHDKEELISMTDIIYKIENGKLVGKEENGNEKSEDSF